MKTIKILKTILLLLCSAALAAACADRSASPGKFVDEGSRDEPEAGKLMEHETAKAQPRPTALSVSSRPVEVELADGANARLVKAKKLLDEGKYEDLVGLIEPAEAQALPGQDRRQLANIYHAAADKVLRKRKDVAFSSMFCERGLLAAPDHQDLLRLQVRNYMHHDMNLISGAEELVEKLVKLDPDDLENQFLRGKIAFEQADWDAAVFWLGKAARVGRTQGGKIIDQAWKLLELAKGRQEEIRSALSMTRELEMRMKRARIIARSIAVKDDEGSAGPSAGLAAPSGGRIVLFMTTWCKHCNRTRKLLKSLNVKFTERDIEKDQSALMEMMQAAQAAGVEVRGVPVVQIGSKLVVGYNESLITSLVNKIR